MGNAGAAGVNTRLIKHHLTYTCSIYPYSPVIHLASLSIVAFEVLNFQSAFLKTIRKDFYGWLLHTLFPFWDKNLFWAWYAFKLLNSVGSFLSLLP